MASCSAENDVKTVAGVCVPDCDGPKLRRSGRACKHCEDEFANSKSRSNGSSSGGLGGGAIAGIIIALIVVGVVAIHMTVGLPGARDKVVGAFKGVGTKPNSNPYAVPRSGNIMNPTYATTDTVRGRVESVTLNMATGSSEM